MIDHGLRNYGWDSSDSLTNHAYTLPAIIDLLPGKNLTILDAGCGNGFIAGKMAELGHTVVGIDISEDGISIARKTYPAIQFEELSVYDDLRAVAKDVDIVISSEVIEHLYYPQRYLENLYSVIRPSGWIILTTPYHGYIKNLALSLTNKWDNHFTVNREGGHIKFFSERTLSAILLKYGFDNIIFNNAGRVKWLWKSMICRAQKNG